MGNFPTREEYGGIAEATEEVMRRLDVIPAADRLLTAELTRGVVRSWTDALTSFAANSEVSQEDGAILRQIESTYKAIEPKLAKQADVLRVGTLETVQPSHVLFMALVRDIQADLSGPVNLNHHKLRVLLDRRYTVEDV